MKNYLNSALSVARQELQELPQGKGRLVDIPLSLCPGVPESSSGEQGGES